MEEKDLRKSERRAVNISCLVFGGLACASSFYGGLAYGLLGAVLVLAAGLWVGGLAWWIWSAVSLWWVNVDPNPVAPALKPRYWPGSPRDRAQRGLEKT